MQQFGAKAAENLDAVRKQRPLIHNITNFVVMNTTANVLLAMGASPVMAHAENEVAEMVGIADALVLNIGTLTADWIDAMETAAVKAAAERKPIVLDPVGAGATTLRTEAARRLIRSAPVRVIRGNASEILALGRADARTKGVDASHDAADAVETARRMAEEHGAVIAVTGPADRVSDGARTLLIENGHPLMAAVTGTGCAATAVIGAFLAVDADAVSAAAAGLAFFGLAGERAAEKASAPGSFQVELINALYTLTPEDLARDVKIREAS